ncbi:MAG: FAD-dependent oxidoreductase [Alphaproteobacteria bacterium]|nr:FAD-dependent oxidoreductase [Alphaproteobacteria bacterium]
MSHAFAELVAPGKIGTMQLRNRMAVTAMGVSFAEPDGVCGDRIRAYHEAQARGGAGLIITGAAGVSWPVGGVQRDQIAVSEDRHLPGMTALAEAVHAHGAKLAFQLHNGGPVGLLDMLAGRPVWVPSVPEPSQPDTFESFLPEELASSAYSKIASVDFREIPLAEIERTVRDFAAAAERVKRSGADGIEIHGGHGYILSSFLSPKSNRRTDAYGGPLENRARLLLEVIAAIRAAVGREFPVWVKIDAREVGKQGGITIEDAVALAKMVEAAGVDAITVTAYHDTDRGKLHSASHTPHEPAVNLPFAARIKAAVGIPVIASGRIEPAVGNAAIASGQVDFITMGRKLLADPDLPRKIMENRPDEIRPCIYCYTCISAIYTHEAARCAVNPELGFEHQTAPLAAGTPRHIVVIGGGPGGMEAARRLDAAGHRVTLLEQGKRLGGTLRFAALAYEANERLLDWLRRRVEGSRIDVRLETRATVELVRSLGPDDVIVATGAQRGLPPIPGADLPHVFSGDDMRALMLGEDTAEVKRKAGLLTRLATKVGATTGISDNLDFIRKATRQWMPFGQRIVIIGGELVGLELAEFLNERGREITVVDEIPRFGKGLSVLRRMRLRDELLEHGVVLQPEASEIRIEEAAVRFRDHSGADQAVPADHVIVARGAAADLDVADQLKAAGFAVHTVGDCQGVGYIEGAMRNAANAAAAISAVSG